MRVLQVEDDTATADAVAQMLASEGHECDIAPLGEEGLALALNNTYDIILLDVMLPDIDGFEVLRRLQAASVHTPVVIQSGLISRDDLEKTSSFGREHCLVKPFSKSELTTRLSAAVAAARTAAQNGPAPADDEACRRHPDRAGHRRQQRRIRTLKSGQIIDVTSKFAVECTIFNISTGGAAIQPDETFDPPGRFLLKIQNGPTHLCEVCWRHGRKLGVRFLHI